MERGARVKEMERGDREGVKETGRGRGDGDGERVRETGRWGMRGEGVRRTRGQSEMTRQWRGVEHEGIPPIKVGRKS